MRDGNNLRYFASRDEKVARGTIDLFELTKISVVKGGPNDIKKEFIMEVGSRIYGFRAKNQEQRDAWIEALVVWVPAKKPGDHITIPRRLYTGIMGCLDYCILNGMDVEGLFRVPGSNSAVNDIAMNLACLGRQYFDNALMPIQYDVFDVGSTLKKILRELPETLFTWKKAERFQKAQTWKEIKQLCSDLPERNKNILRKLAKLCKLLCENKSTTSMHPGALSVCLTPCLSAPDSVGFVNLTKLIELFVSDYNQIFNSHSRNRSVSSQSPREEHRSRASKSVIQSEELVSPRRRDSPIKSPYNDFPTSSVSIQEVNQDEVLVEQEQKFDSNKEVDLLEFKVNLDSDSESEYLSMLASFMELKRSSKLNTEIFRSTVGLILQAADQSLGDISSDNTKEENVNTRNRLWNKKQAAKPMDSSADLLREKKRSALLASRIVELEQALAFAQQNSALNPEIESEVAARNQRMGALISSLLNNLNDQLVPTLDDLRREHRLQKKAIGLNRSSMGKSEEFADL